MNREKDYDADEARKEFISRTEAEGFIVDFPLDNELQIDLDSEEHLRVFNHSLPIFARDMMLKYGWEVKPTITPSRSGLPRQHVRILMPMEMGCFERIAWQAALGSDPTRELLSCFRVANGDDHPTLFVEAPDYKKPIP